MKLRRHNSDPTTRTATRRRAGRGWTLIEVLLAMGIGTVLLAMLGAFSIYGLRSFVAVSNYSDLDGKSRQALDYMLRDMRQATQVIAFNTNLASGGKSLTVANTNTATATFTNRYVWDSTARTMTCEQWGVFTNTFLSGCDRWEFSLWQRTPQPNTTNIFFPATNAAGDSDASLCKLISMNWKCSRNMLGKKWNTESVQTAQIVLRNKE